MLDRGQQQRRARACCRPARQRRTSRSTHARGAPTRRRRRGSAAPCPSSCSSGIASDAPWRRSRTGCSGTSPGLRPACGSGRAGSGNSRAPRRSAVCRLTSISAIRPRTEGRWRSCALRNRPPPRSPSRASRTVGQREHRRHALVALGDVEQEFLGALHLLRARVAVEQRRQDFGHVVDVRVRRRARTRAIAASSSPAAFDVQPLDACRRARNRARPRTPRRCGRAPRRSRAARARAARRARNGTARSIGACDSPVACFQPARVLDRLVPVALVLVDRDQVAQRRRRLRVHRDQVGEQRFGAIEQARAHVVLAELEQRDGLLVLGQVGRAIRCWCTRIARSTSPRRRNRLPSARCVSTVSRLISASLQEHLDRLVLLLVEQVVQAAEIARRQFADARAGACARCRGGRAPSRTTRRPAAAGTAAHSSVHGMRPSLRRAAGCAALRARRASAADAGAPRPSHADAGRRAASRRAARRAAPRLWARSTCAK